MPIVCNYSLIRIVPNRATGEFANVGVILSCPQERYFGFRLEERYDRLMRFFPSLSSQTASRALEELEKELKGYEAEGTKRAAGTRDAGDEQRLVALMRHLTRPREALIQYGPISTSLAEDPRAELEFIFRREVSRNFSPRLNGGQYKSDPVMEQALQAQELEEQKRKPISPWIDSARTGKIAEAVLPVYTTSEANVPIELHNGTITLLSGEQELYCEGIVRYEWVPTPDVVLHVKQGGNETEVLSDLGLGDDIAYINLLGADGPISITNTTIQTGQAGHTVDVKGFLPKGLEVGYGEDLHAVVFHLVNFIPMLHLPVYYGEFHSALARAEASFDGWRLTVDTVENFSKLEKSLSATRGSGITHAVRLERVDGATFSSKQALEIQSALFWFFSFARGFASPPILPVGFDSRGDRVWESWHAMRSTAWRGSSGWLSDRQYVSASLEEALRGFWRRWNDPPWNDADTKNTPLIRAIHWFLSANTDAGGIEGSIILAETGLELMAWVLLVEAEKLYGADQFKAFSGTEKFRRLLEYIGVDEQIPLSLGSLRTLAEKRGWRNGPEAIAEFRDGTLHPDLRASSSEVAFRETYEILELALWYLELSILHVLGYSGYYVNRTRLDGFAGDTERVPWAKIEVLQPTG